jgi:hypothetical protein
MKHIALGAFLELERAFDRTSFDTRKVAADKYGTDSTICRWIFSIITTALEWP